MYGGETNTKIHISGSKTRPFVFSKLSVAAQPKSRFFTYLVSLIVQLPTSDFHFDSETESVLASQTIEDRTTAACSSLELRVEQSSRS